MADRKPTAGAKSGMNIDTAFVRELAELLAETGLTEIEVEDSDRKIRVARGGLVAAAPAVAAPMPAAAPAAPAPTAEAPAAAGADHADALKSPMVGTAYLAAEPGSPNFVKVGDSVEQGDTLLIIEAMKTMNHIPAPRAGTVMRILIEDGAAVEYGAPLMIIE